MGTFSNLYNLSFASVLPHFNVQFVFIVSNMITNLFRLLYFQFVNPSRKKHLSSYGINYMVLPFVQLVIQHCSRGGLIRSNRITWTDGGKEVKGNSGRFYLKKGETTNGHDNKR